MFPPPKRSGARRYPGKAGEFSPRHGARSFVVVQLLDGPKTWKEIAAEGEKFGQSESTMRLVRHEVATLKHRKGQPPLWVLKEEARPNGPQSHSG